MGGALEVPRDRDPIAPEAGVGPRKESLDAARRQTINLLDTCCTTSIA